MCGRLTVLSDPPMASAISGCVIPLSRSNTIWIRCRIVGFLSRFSARCTRLTWSLLHLIIWAPESGTEAPSESHPECSGDPPSRHHITGDPFDSCRYGRGSNHPPAKPGAFVHEPLKAAVLGR